MSKQVLKTYSTEDLQQLFKEKKSAQETSGLVHQTRTRQISNWSGIHYMQEATKDPFLRLAQIDTPYINEVRGVTLWDTMKGELIQKFPKTKIRVVLDYYDEDTDRLYPEDILIFPYGDNRLMLQTSLEVIDKNSIKRYDIEELDRTIMSRMAVYSSFKDFDWTDKEYSECLSTLAKMMSKNFVAIKTRSKIGLLTVSDLGYEVSYHEIEKPKIGELDLYYGKGFTENVHKKMLDNIEQNKAGLNIFQGEPGTGKTTYIKHLVASLSDKTDFIYIPPEMISRMTGPDMVEFIIENCTGSVFVIEDAERALLDREISPESSSLVSNILNMADGMMSDIIQAQFICTINKNRQQMDPALFRKGRLLMDHEFLPLSEEEANVLAKANDIDRTFEKAATLADIFNEGDESHKVKESKVIGFRTGNI